MDLYNGGYTILPWKGSEKLMTNEHIDESKDIHFLFDKQKWCDKRISDMTSSHIINTLLMLRRRANEFKLNYELFVIDNMNNNLLVPKDDINRLAPRPANDWIIETPIYVALLEEIEKRKLDDYFDLVIERTKKEEI